MEPSQERENKPVETVQSTEPASSSSQEPVATSVQEPLVTTPTYAADTRKSRALLIASIIAGIAVVIAAGYYVYAQYYAKGGVVAVVNDKEIYQTELTESMKAIEENAAFYGIDPASPDKAAQVQERALDTLINNAVLITAAENAGFTTDDAEVQASYEQLTEQVGGADELATQMAAVGLTEQKLRNSLRERELVRKYVESETDIENITVSDEEVSAFIDSLRAGNVELPEELDSLKPQIQAQILGQKQQQVVADMVSRLKETASIEIRI